MGVTSFKGRSQYRDRCKWYKKDEADLSSIEMGTATPRGVFYKNDVEPFGFQKIWNGDRTSSAVFFQGTIDTIDDIDGLKPDDYVELDDGEIYRVVAPVIQDGDPRKRVAKDAYNHTIMTLRRPDDD